MGKLEKLKSVLKESLDSIRELREDVYEKMIGVDEIVSKLEEIGTEVSNIACDLDDVVSQVEVIEEDLEYISELSELSEPVSSVSPALSQAEVSGQLGFVPFVQNHSVSNLNVRINELINEINSSTDYTVTCALRRQLDVLKKQRRTSV